MHTFCTIAVLLVQKGGCTVFLAKRARDTEKSAQGNVLICKRIQLSGWGYAQMHSKIVRKYRSAGRNKRKSGVECCVFA